MNDKDEIRMTVKGLIYAYALSSVVKKKASLKEANQISKDILEANKQAFGIGIFVGKDGLAKGLKKVMENRKKFEKGLILLQEAGIIKGGD